MFNSQQVSNILAQLATIKTKIRLNDLTIGHLIMPATHSRCKTYETVDFLWLNIVLNSIKVISIREKINFLRTLSNSKQNKNLRFFYIKIGIKNFSLNIPSIGVFSDYVKYFDKIELENLLNQALKLIKHLKINNSSFNLVSIDGKDIRNCKNFNQKSVNIVENKILTQSFLVDHEMTWIKNNLIEFIKNNFSPQDVFISDGAYHNTQIRRFFSQNGFKAILPMKNLTKTFKERINTVIDFNRFESIRATSVNKRNKHIVEENLTLVPTESKIYKEFNQWNYLIKIVSKSTCITTDKEHIKTRLFLTNLDLPRSEDTLKTLRQLITQHWQVVPRGFPSVRLSISTKIIIYEKTRILNSA